MFNPFEEECRIIEIQYGDETSEEDIERLEFYQGMMSNDYKVKDITLAEFGRQEILLAQDEMPALMQLEQLP